MELKEIQIKEQWNAFVLECNPNTFLQSWEWGQVQKNDGEKVRYLGAFEGDVQVGAALLITVGAKRGTHLLCPHGPIAKDDEMIRRIIKELAAYAKSIAASEGIVALRIAPLLEVDTQTESFFKELSFRPAPMHVHAELTWVKDISGDEVQIMQDMRKTTRHAVRKAGKEGVTVTVHRDAPALERFWPLYTATKTRHDFVPFPKSFIVSQLEEFKKEGRAFVIIAQYKGEDVAAAIVMQFGTTAFYYHGASKKLPSSVPAAQMLQFEAMKEAKRSGCTQYNFWGIAPDDEPNHPFAGITIFKKGFGGSAINYMHAQDLPLSPKYWILWSVEMYRKWKKGF